MATDRTIKELLQVLLDYFKEDVKASGLCYSVFWAGTGPEKVITLSERLKLQDYVDKNLPKRVYAKNEAYNWKPYAKACRIKWLTKQINSLQHGKDL